MYSEDTGVGVVIPNSPELPPPIAKRDFPYIVL